MATAFGIHYLMKNGNAEQTIGDTLSFLFNYPLGLFFILLITGLISVLFVLPNGKKGLDGIKNTVAGDGQFGTSRFLTEAEKKQLFTYEEYGTAVTNGIVVGSDEKGVLIDHSDSHMIVVAPPDSGKTKSVVEPTLFHNIDVLKNNYDGAASIIATDVKGDLYNETSKGFEEAGYQVYRLDFRNVLQSIGYNFMHLTNKYIDISRSTDDYQEGLHAEALAERYAKVLANMINGELDSSQGGGDGSSKFFDATSTGLMTSLILVVSRHGYKGERHLISVFRMILELNGLIEGATETNQKNRLEEMFSLFEEQERAEFFAGAAVKADVRTSMNVFASAISKLLQFLDVEIEQLISGDENELDIIDFIEKPSIIYLVIPDEDPTRHFMGSLFLRNIINELVEYAQLFPGNRLPRDVIVIGDEFGQFPKISYWDQTLSAARSRGIRILHVIQSFFQLDLRYNEKVSGLIKGVCQIVLFFAIAPSDNKTKKELMEMLGTYTTRTGSTNSSHTTSNTNSSSSGTSEQLSKRDLMDAAEIGRLERGTVIVQKYGMYPMKNKVTMARDISSWKQYLVGKIDTAIKPIQEISALTEKKLMIRLQKKKEYKPLYVYEDYNPKITVKEPEEQQQEVTKIQKRLLALVASIDDTLMRLKIIEYIEEEAYIMMVEFLQENSEFIPENFIKISCEILTKEGIV